jgi:hypothetical protein
MGQPATWIPQMSFARRLAHHRFALSTAVVLAFSGLSIAPQNVQAVAWHVQNCNDSGAGSLRDTMVHATDGDTVDLTNLSCAMLSLTSGPLVLPHSLTLKGPGANLLAISAGQQSRVIQSTNFGLSLESLTLRDGAIETTNASAAGGCVYSNADVSLKNVDVTNCSAAADTGVASGGAMWVSGALLITDSAISDSSASSLGSIAEGGGIQASGPLFITRSTIKGNEVKSYEPSWGGGVVGSWDVAITSSTFSDNRADYAAALFLTGPAGTKFLTDSTIAQNTAAITISALRTDGPIKISNSTIAHNRSSGTSTIVEGGAVLINGWSNVATINSSIIAANTTLEGAALTDIVGNGAIYKKSLNNLIVSSAMPLPPGTISACPRLGNLAANGGPTETLALQPASPAIDAGNNAASLATDQRGQTRVIGLRADIGAYELQSANGGSSSGGYKPGCY